MDGQVSIACLVGSSYVRAQTFRLNFVDFYAGV